MINNTKDILKLFHVFLKLFKYAIQRFTYLLNKTTYYSEYSTNKKQETIKDNNAGANFHFPSNKHPRLSTRRAASPPPPPPLHFLRPEPPEFTFPQSLSEIAVEVATRREQSRRYFFFSPSLSRMIVRYEISRAFAFLQSLH